MRTVRRPAPLLLSRAWAVAAAHGATLPTPPLSWQASWHTSRAGPHACPLPPCCHQQACTRAWYTSHSSKRLAGQGQTCQHWLTQARQHPARGHLPGECVRTVPWPVEGASRNALSPLPAAAWQPPRNRAHVLAAAGTHTGHVAPAQGRHMPRPQAATRTATHPKRRGGASLSLPLALPTPDTTLPPLRPAPMPCQPSLKSASSWQWSCLPELIHARALPPEPRPPTPALARAAASQPQPLWLRGCEQSGQLCAHHTPRSRAAPFMPHMPSLKQQKTLLPSCLPSSHAHPARPLNSDRGGDGDAPPGKLESATCSLATATPAQQAGSTATRSLSSCFILVGSCVGGR